MYGGQRPGRYTSADQPAADHPGSYRFGQYGQGPDIDGDVDGFGQAVQFGRGDGVQRVGVGPQQPGGTGQVRGQARAERVLQVGQDLAQPGPGVRRIAVVRVLPRLPAGVGGGGPDQF